MPSAQPRHILLALLAGASALMVVHGLGRFAFTPLLPHLIADGLLNLEQGARLATWNYIGYLLGALLALALHAPVKMRMALPVALVLNAALTLAQGFTEDYSSLLWLRLANGISNGLVFVQAPALVLEWLAQQQRTRLSGLVYLGLGGGLLLSSGLADWPAAGLGGAARWWPVAALALPLAVLSACLLARLPLQPQPATAQCLPPALLDRASIPLFLAYAGAGLGYILPMTFLPALARDQLLAGDPLLTGTWRWKALACLISIALWNALGSHLGDRRALLCSYLLQAIGCAAPLLIPGTIGLVLCAVLVGGTFMGSVLLTQRLARSLQPNQGIRLSAALIALYGGAQLAGPWLAGLWLEHGGNLQQSFAFGTLALLWALVWSWFIPLHPTHHTGA